MKALKYITLIAALSGALALSAKADLMFLGAVPFGPDNNPDTNLQALADFLNVDPGTLTLCDNFEEVSGPQNIDVMPGAYLVVHYGTGKGGSNPGGSWEFFQVINGETNVTVPGTGNVAGADPFGHGGISSIREFCPVPDSGSTVMLLGVAIGSVEMLRRLVLKKRSPKI
jgi:hypothetical protein